ncbi:hypothetical protein S100892_00039 (plasmid) [Pediococcus pentosaceus]|uniref:Uncharacterized protein n=1 Tax=Pediococcus pentosaceus TaxID=1255 RepID=A0A1Y0VKH8_PEDPE|nr:hypothetical protein S100892_00039 [Pediococcus pentosaceus]
MKVIITTHAQAGSGLILAFAMIAGNSSVFKTCLLNDSGIADFRTRLNALLASFQGEDILTSRAARPSMKRTNTGWNILNQPRSSVVSTYPFYWS